MSAIVTVLFNDKGATRDVAVPGATQYSIETIGTDRILHLQGAWGTQYGCFRSWVQVVIKPERGPDGKFVKKGR